MRTISNKYLYFTLLSIVFIFYFLCLSPFVQGGDTAELVLASNNLYVAHPPGYPLFIWLNFFWNKLFIFSSDYFRASFLNLIFSFATIWLLTKHHVISKSKFLWLLLIYFLSTPIIEATILPDVFALHGLFIAWMFINFRHYYTNDLEKLTYIGFPFFLGLTNHLTIVLLIPLLIAAFLKINKDSYFRLRFIVRTLIAIFLATLIYLTIFLFNTKSYYSWGDLENLSSLLKHFIRYEYGTFKFAPQNSESNLLSNYFFFLKENYFSIIFLCLPIILSLKSINICKKFLPLIISILLSLLFLSTSNFNLDNFGSEIIIRFHTLPLLTLLFSLSIIFEFQSNIQLNKLQNFALTIVVAFSFVRIVPYLKLRNDSLMENYFQNIMATADASQSSIILANNDSEYFGLRYFQKQNNLDKISVISAPLFFHSWYFDKITRNNDRFILNNQKVIIDQKSIDIEKDIVIPNLEASNILVLRNFNNKEKYNIVFQKIGRVLTKLNHPPIHIIDLKYPFIGYQFAAPNSLYSKNFFLDTYAYYYIEKAMNYYQINDLRKSLFYLKSALMISPNNLKIKENICSINKNEPSCKN